MHSRTKNYDGPSPHFHVPTKQEASNTRGSIANKDQVRQTIGRDSFEKIGTYTMSTGGGKPLKKGEKAPSAEWVAENRVAQPRDHKGQFTYNSVNGIPLKEESRGETVPPFLLGVQLNFATKAVNVTIESGKFVNHLRLNMSKDEFIRAFQEYDLSKGFKTLASTVVRKKGRRSQEEKDAIAAGVDGAIGANLTKIEQNQFEIEFVSIFENYKGSPYLANVIGMIKELDRGKSGSPFVPIQPKPITPKPITPPSHGQNTQQQPSAPSQTGGTTQTTPQQPSATQEATTQEATPSGQDADKDMAKNNPKGFVEKHQDKIDELVDYAKSKGIDVTLDSIVDDFADGKSFDDMKKEIDGFNGVDTTEKTETPKEEAKVEEKSKENSIEQLKQEVEEENKKAPDADYVPGEKPEKPVREEPKVEEKPSEEKQQVSETPKAEQPTETPKTEQPTAPKKKITKTSELASQYGISKQEVAKIYDKVKATQGAATLEAVEEAVKQYVSRQAASGVDKVKSKYNLPQLASEYGYTEDELERMVKQNQNNPNFDLKKLLEQKKRSAEGQERWDKTHQQQNTDESEVDDMDFDKIEELMQKYDIPESDTIIRMIYKKNYKTWAELEADLEKMKAEEAYNMQFK